jgi:hypothetical protein
MAGFYGARSVIDISLGALRTGRAYHSQICQQNRLSPDRPIRRGRRTKVSKVFRTATFRRAAVFLALRSTALALR